MGQLLGTSPANRGATWNVLRHRGALVFCHPRGVFNFDFKTDRLNLIHGSTGYSISNCEQLGSRLLVSQRKTASTESMLVTLDLNTGTRVANSKGLPEFSSTRDALGLYDVLTDNRGTHWVLMGNHLYRSRGPNGDFVEVKLPFKPFGREDVFAMSPSGVVWLRTDDNGLARFSRHAKRFFTIKPPADLSPSSRVRNIAVDRDNNVWLSNAGSKLLHWNRSDDTWVDQLPGNAVTIKAITSLPDGTVWVALSGNNQLIGFDPETRTWKHEYQFRLLFSAFSQTSDGRLLFSSERHVFVLAPGTGQLEQVTQRPVKGQIRALLQDSAGNTWVGTHENGLTKIGPSGHIQQWITENSGLSLSLIHI